MGWNSCPAANRLVTIKRMKPINLADSGPEVVGGSTAEPYYPSAHIRVPEDKGELKMPDEGTVTFKYRLRRETTVNQPNGKTVCEYDLDLISLEGYKGTPDERPSKRDTSTEDSLDKLMKQKEKASKKDGDEGY